MALQTVFRVHTVTVRTQTKQIYYTMCKIIRTSRISGLEYTDFENKNDSFFKVSSAEIPS